MLPPTSGSSALPSRSTGTTRAWVAPDGGGGLGSGLSHIRGGGGGLAGQAERDADLAQVAGNYAAAEDGFPAG